MGIQNTVADISVYVETFHEFFTTIYKKKIDQLTTVYPAQKSLLVEYSDLEKFDPILADALIKTPDLVLAAAEDAIKSLNLVVAVGNYFTPHIRFVGFPTNEKLIEQLSSKNINELVAFRCVVTKRAEVMHRVKVAVYKCELCESEMKVFVGKNFTPPKRCESCKKFALKQDEEASSFVDIQRAEVQELLEKIRGGAPAAHIELLLEDDLVNKVAPGDNIEVAGTLRLRPPLKTRQKQELVYSRFVEINSVKSLKKDFEDIEITKEEEKEFEIFSKKSNLEITIANSIAPSIYGHTEVKRALALHLFGGTRGKTMSGGMPIRDDIHILLIGDPGIAKCTSGDSKVLLADGSTQRIDEIVEDVLKNKNAQKMEDGMYAVSNHGIISMNLSGKTAESKATYFWKLDSPEFLYEVETASGRKVTVSPEHPFFVCESGFIKPKAAQNLNEKEFIATPRIVSLNTTHQELPGIEKGKTNSNRILLPKTLDKEFARLIGYLTGDGYFRRTSSYEISLTNCEDELLQDFEIILKNMNLPTSSKIVRDGNKKTKVCSAFSVELGKILEKIGILKTSFEKTVPQIVMKSPNEIAIEYIKAYFDCEANISKQGITVVSASRDLLESVRLLLLRFGILCQIHHTHSRATNSKTHQKTKYHRMFILGENAAKYGEIISFNLTEKRQKLAKLGKKYNTNIDVVPNLKNILKLTRTSLGLSQLKCGIPRSTYQHFERGDRNPSRNSLRKIVGSFAKVYSLQNLLLDAPGKSLRLSLSVLETLSKSNIFWDKVKTIKKIKPNDKWVYDLQVNDTHNFIANSMFVHNSRFLHSVSEIAPKSIYVSGKTVSGAGLSVTAEKDELGEGGWTLKAGALVLASGGTAQIDEFDKIEEEDLAALHEALESQTISVAKAGIVATFVTKTAVLAAANPKYGRFDQTKNLSDQFDIPPTLLSRFDLIFPIVDVLDEEKDSKLAEYILSTHMGLGKENEQEKDSVDREFLRKYIAYARRKIFPKLTAAASKKIKEYYVDLRRKGKEAGAVAITPRYLEGLVRLSEANAKMRLSQVVEESDAELAILLFNYVMQQIMTDKSTGLLDVDVVATGKPKSEREKLQKADTVLDIIREHLRKSDTAEIEKIVEEAKTYDIDETTSRRIIAEMLRRGVVYEKEYGHLKMVGE